MVYYRSIFIFLTIFLSIFFILFSPSLSYGAQVVNPTEQVGDYTIIYDDSYFNLYLWEYNWQDELITRLWYAKGDSNYSDVVNRIFNVSLGLGNNGRSILVLRDSESDAFTVYLVDMDQFSYAGNSIVTGTVNMGGIEFPNQKVYSGYFGKIASINTGGGTAYNPSVGVSNYIAAPMLGIFNPRWVDLFTYYGLISSSTTDYNSQLSNIMFNQSQLISQISNGVNAINNQTNVISNTIEESTSSTNEELEVIQDKIDDTNEFLQSTDVDDSNYNLPSIDVSDPTTSGIDNIFTTIYNAFIEDPPRYIVIPFPFTSKSIPIDPYYTATVLRTYTGSWIIDFVRAFYWFLISRYIIKDISKIIKKIKSGDVDNLENENIKEEML